MKYFGIIIGGAGWGILFYQNWIVAIGVALAMWGYEVQLRPPADGGK